MSALALTHFAAWKQLDFSSLQDINVSALITNKPLVTNISIGSRGSQSARNAPAWSKIMGRGAETWGERGVLTVLQE